ncbi:unnamed protein product [Effrenium voratum]|uniref:RNase NYN domain-containing protein n=1 Tax=Effrenium voratum TaxID=2562239 RepID=A0AA36IF21_9DINO|nr:unnamed protein product [Effrenium voratum]
MLAPPSARPAELSALLEIDPAANPANYWRRNAWDVEAIKRDIRAVCGEGLPERRDGTFSSLVSTLRSGKAAGKAVSKGSGQDARLLSLGKSQGSSPGPRTLHPTKPHPPPLGSKVVPDKMPDVDNEGRPYNLKLVVVNFNNVGTKYGILFHKDEECMFNWEGVRRCAKELTKRCFKVIGVIYQNWRAYDGDQWVDGIPQDIRSMCESIQETPRIAGINQKSADDEMTIKCAYHRNCRLLDNDNYKDWLHTLRKDEIRDWYQFSQHRIHMKYFFDSQVGFFETLDGNAARGASEEREDPRRKSRNRVAGNANASSAANARPNEQRVCVTPPDFTARAGPVLAAPAPAGPAAASAVPSAPATHAALGLAVMVPTITGFRQHRGPTITMPTITPAPSSAVDLTAEPPRRPAAAMNMAKAGWTPLCAAAQQGKIDAAKRLLDAGADPNIPNALGAHPIFYALHNWSLRMFRLLLKHGGSMERARSERGETLKAYVERKVKQAGQLKRGGAAFFSTASRQELLKMVGARKAAQSALESAALARKRRRSDAQIQPPKARARVDPYGGSVNAVDLTEAGSALRRSGNQETREADLDMDDNSLATLLGAAMQEEIDAMQDGDATPPATEPGSQLSAGGLGEELLPSQPPWNW